MDTIKILETISMFLGGSITTFALTFGVKGALSRLNKSFKDETKNYNVMMRQMDSLVKKINDNLERISLLEEEVRKDLSEDYMAFKTEITEKIDSIPEKIKIDSKELAIMLQQMKEIINKFAEVNHNVANIRRKG